MQRRYLADSALLETRFLTANGIVVLTDFFVVARTANSRFYDFTSLHPTRKLVRTVRLEGGSSVAMQLLIRAGPDYARRGPAWRTRRDGYEMLETAFLQACP